MTKPQGKDGTPFMPQAAKAYAADHKYKLPKKAEKNVVLLAEVVEECIMEEVKGIPKEDRFECTRCGSTVQEPDEYC